jgi:hypothetical protein
VGASIPVRVCAVKADLSVVEPGFYPCWWVLLVFAIVLVLFGLTIFDSSR